MTIAEIEERLEKLPDEIYEVEKHLIRAQAEYEHFKSAFETQVAVCKVRVQENKNIPNNFAKDIALSDSAVIDIRQKLTLAKIKVMKWQAEYDRRDREFKAVRKIANLKQAEVNRFEG